MTDQIGRFLVATGAIIEHSSTGKILLLKRSNEKDFSAGIWEYVTGRLHQFEAPEDGLRREIMEEAGIDVEIIKPISTFHIFRGEKLPENELVGVMYWCRTNDENIKISDEHSEFMWVSPDEALKMIEKPSMQEDIKAYIKERKLNKFTVAVFGIITDEQDRVLFCHRRDYDLWNLPGGGVELGENPQNAMIREIKEETGLDTTLVHLTGVYSKPNKNEIVLSFACQVTGGEITLNDEADRIEYFEIDQVPRNISQSQVGRVKEYFADKSKTYFRVQTGPSSIELIRAGKM